MNSENTPEPDELPDDAEASESALPSSKRRRRVSSQRSHFTAIQRPRWESWVMALIPLLIVFLGGGRSVFAKGAALTLTGLVMTIAPPNYRLPKGLRICLAGLAFVPLLSFLPATWVGHIPEWRTSLSDDWGIVLSNLATVQPWVTLESWLIFASGITWLAWCVSRGSTADDRRVVLKLLALGIAAIAVLTLLHKAEMIHILWWKFPPELGYTFGPFANRNHTSSLMSVASILAAALAYDSYRSKQLGWIVYLALLAPLFMVIMSNTSRAGALLFFLGITVWLWTAAMKKGLFKKVALVATLLLGGISAIVIVGGTINDRLSTIGKDGILGIAEGRSKLYSDVLKMTSQAPWTGIGLGNFVDVFPQAASFHEPKIRFLHPESDLLWLLAEGGMVAAFLLVAALGLVTSMTGPWSTSRDDESGSRQDRRLRHACTIGAWIAIGHGIVDVPNHGLAYGLLSTMLMGLSIRPSKVKDAASGWERAVLRSLGAGVSIVGICLLCTFFGHPILPGRAAAKMLAQEARNLSQSNRDGEAMKLAERAIALNPLDWTLYFLRATLHLNLKHSERDALLDFGRARAIEPHYAAMCIEEGRVWLDYRSRFAIQAWKEFLRRQPERTDYFDHLLGMIAHDPEMRQEARKLAVTAPLKLVFLRQTNASPEFDEVLNELLQMPKGMEALEPEGRLELFQLWQQRSNRDQLKAALIKNPSWQQDGWRVLCEELAREGDYEGAYRLATRYEAPPISPSVSDFHELAELQRNFDMNPIDPRRGIDLFFAQKAKGDWSEALATLEKISGLPNAPSYIMYEKAVAYAGKADFRSAWESLAKYLTARR